MVRAAQRRRRCTAPAASTSRVDRHDLRPAVPADVEVSPCSSPSRSRVTSTLSPATSTTASRPAAPSRARAPTAGRRRTTRGQDAVALDAPVRLVDVVTRAAARPAARPWPQSFSPTRRRSGGSARRSVSTWRRRCAPGRRSRRRRRGSPSRPGTARRSACGGRRSRPPGGRGTSARRQLAVEDVAADQPVLVLHLVRADHLAVQDRVGEARAPPRPSGATTPVGVGLELGLRAARVLHVVRHPLGEHRHDVLARRAPGSRRTPRGCRCRRTAASRGRPATASWKAPSTSSSDSASTIVPPCTSGSKPGLGGELRQPVDGEVDLHRAAARLPASRCRRRSRPAGRGGRPGRRNAICGCAVVMTVGARQLLAGLEHHARRARRRALVICATAASVRISAPNDRAADAIAW